MYQRVYSNALLALEVYGGVCVGYVELTNPKQEAWTFRDSLPHFARRNASVHYKQTVIGMAWTLVHPLVTVAFLTVVISNVAKFEADRGARYPLLVLASILVQQIIHFMKLLDDEIARHSIG